MLKYDPESPTLSWLRLAVCFSLVCSGTAGIAYLSWRIHWIVTLAVTVPTWILLACLLITGRQSLTWYLLDFIRHVLVFGATALTVWYLWTLDWRLGAIVALPVFVLSLNLFGFLTLRLYDLTPEVRAGQEAFGAFEEGDYSGLEDADA